MKQILFLITLISLPLLLGLVKEKQDECLPCKECYDIAWDDGYGLGLATGETRERYSIVRTLIKMGKTDEEIVQKAHSSFYELEQVKKRLKQYNGKFKWEVQ